MKSLTINMAKLFAGLCRWGTFLLFVKTVVIAIVGRYGSSNGFAIDMG